MSHSGFLLNVMLVGCILISSARSATVYLVIGSDTAIWDGMSVTQYHNTYDQSLYTSPEMNAYTVMDPAFRSQFTDSYGQAMKMTWWMMAGNIFRYATNTNFPVNNIMTLYLMKEYHGENLILNGDELSLHYHTFVWTDYDQDGMYFWNQALGFEESRADFDITLSQFLLEEDVFPVSFRSGWHYMDNDWQQYLNELLPYSMHNAWPVNRVDTQEPLDNTYNWSESPSEFVPYRPAVDNYMIDGDGPGWNVRSVSFSQVVNSDLMEQIFTAADQGTDQVACIWSHLPEADFPQRMAQVDSAAQAALDLYPGVTFRYCTAVEAMQRWRGGADQTAPDITINTQGAGENLRYSITASEPLFMPQPFAAVKYKDGSYRRLVCTPESPLTWTTEAIPFPDDLAKLGIAATDTFGNLATAFIRLVPDEIYLDDQDADHIQWEGPWLTVDEAAWGTTSRRADISAGQPARVIWSPEIETTGSYHVFLQVPPTGSPEYSVQAVLHSAMDTDTVALMAPLPGNAWIYLGTPLVESGQPVVAELFSNVTSPIEGAVLAADVLKLSALVRDRDFHLETTHIEFGDIALNQVAQQAITPRNRGLETLSILNIQSLNGQVSIQTSLPLSLDPMSSASITLQLIPQELGFVGDTVRFWTDDPMHPALDLLVSAQVTYPFQIVDDADPAGYWETGAWYTSVAQAWGASSRYAYLGAGASAHFETELAEPGHYEIQYIVPRTVNASDHALYRLLIDGTAVDSLYLDQNTGSGVWCSLGIYDLPAGQPIALEVHDRGGHSNGPVLRADAVKFQMLDPSDLVDDPLPLHPSRVVLHQNFPNPFNPSTTLAFDLPESGEMSLRIFDVTGRKIATLFQGPLQAGRHDLRWSALDDRGIPVNAGIYVARIRQGDLSASIKLLYLK